MASLSAVVRKTLAIRDFQKAIREVRWEMKAALEELRGYLHSLSYRREEVSAKL